MIARKQPTGFWSIEARPWAIVSILVAFLGSGASNVIAFYQRDAAQGQQLVDYERELSRLDARVGQLERDCIHR